MGKIKVLFLAYFYPPAKYPRAVQISHLSSALPKDIDLKIITLLPDGKGDQSLMSFTSLDNVLYAQKSKAAQFLERIKGDRLKKANLPDVYYFWHYGLYKKAVQYIQESGADIIVTFGQPMSTHVTGLKLKKKFPHLKWIAHFSDPWVDNVFNQYNKWLKFINTFYQNLVFKAANKLIFTSQETIEYVAKGSAEILSKAIVMPHCFRKDLYTATSPANPEKAIVIRYLGNFYGNRQPDVLFEALKRISDLKEMEVRVELIGVATSNIVEKIKNNNLENMVFALPSVPYLESLTLMKSADLLLIIDAPGQESPFLPSKLVDYIGAGRPVFGITPPGTAQKLIEKMGFLTANPLNTEDIAQKLSQMIKDVRESKVVSMPQNIQDYYEARNVGEQMKETLYSLMS